jgi:AraC family transcriptional regulator
MPDDRYLREYEFRINLVLEYIRNHIDDDLGLAQLAGVSFFSQSHFHRIFCAFVGETPQDFIRRVRLEKAYNMIRMIPSMSITDITLACGITSSSLFSRIFKNHHKISPSELRKEIQVLDRMKSKRKAPLNINSDDVQIKELPSRRLAFLVNIGYNSGIFLAYSKLMRWAKDEKILRGDTLLIGIPLDDPSITETNKCRFYACITIPEDVEPTGNFGLTKISGGDHAVYRFKGSRKQLETAYQYLYTVWLPENGYEPQEDPSYQVRLSEPGKYAIGNLSFEICIPLRKIQFHHSRKKNRV